MTLEHSNGSIIEGYEHDKTQLFYAGPDFRTERDGVSISTSLLAIFQRRLYTKDNVVVYLWRPRIYEWPR